MPDSHSQTIQDATRFLNEARKSVGLREQEYANELLLAADHLSRRSNQYMDEGDEAHAKSLMAGAEKFYSWAGEITVRVRAARTLEFPRGRSLGTLSVKPWKGSDWTSIGEARGNIEIEANHMVQLGVHSGFSDTDLDVLVKNGPGAIQYLSLSGIVLTDDLIARLDDLVGLRDLSLYRTKISDEQLQHVAELLALRHLNVMATPLSDAGMNYLVNLPALEELAIGDTTVTDRGIYAISRLPRLRVLVARGLELSDVSIDYLSRTPALEVLWVGGAHVTDYGVPLFTEMSKLKELVLLDTGVSKHASRQLERSLPGVNIDHVGG